MKNPVDLVKKLIKRLCLGSDYQRKTRILGRLKQSGLEDYIDEDKAVELVKLLSVIDIKKQDSFNFVRNILSLLGQANNTGAIDLLIQKYFERGTQQLQNQISSSEYHLLSEINKQLHLSAKLLNNKAVSEDMNLADQEYKVYSQFGQDGILQFLLKYLPIAEEKFVEFGVENYFESTTRFLLEHNNWSGLVMDGSEAAVQTIKMQAFYWQHNLTAQQVFITKENINGVLRKNNVTGDIGLLVVDIDGNDYWVWKEIDVIQPRIVFCEYNSVFGNKFKVTVPYTKDFYRTKEHHSNLYFGASLQALKQMATSKGYVFFSSNSNGNDAIFIRKDLVKYLPKIKTLDYIKSKFRESRDENGALTYISGDSRLELIKDKLVFNLETAKSVKIKELYGLK